jgi:hypothetical protein
LELDDTRFNPNERPNDEVGMTGMDEKKAPKERVDVANEPVDLDEEDGMVDTGVLHELPKDAKDARERER